MLHPLRSRVVVHLWAGEYVGMLWARWIMPVRRDIALFVAGVWQLLVLWGMLDEAQPCCAGHPVLELFAVSAVLPASLLLCLCNTHSA